MSARELAAAIRKGAALRPQCIGNYFRDGTSCAFGAAWEGSGRRYDEMRVFIASKMAVEFGITLLQTVDIVNMNDAGQTREQIADWLDTLEPAQRQTFESFMAATLKSVDVETDHAKHP